MRHITNKQFGKYNLLEHIGTGGMAEVFKAKFTGEMGFEKLLVIKKVLPHLAAEDQWVGQFVDEARLAALLHHDNIIHIYDFGSIDGSWFIAMEYLAGQDLKTLVHQAEEHDHPLPQELALHITAKICEGLDYAHTLADLENTPLNIIHRDISPQNIYVTYDGHVKIIDFGIAKTSAKSTQTQTGTIKGKFSYMSPEQVSAKSIDHRSDIFATGLILYELLTGEKAFTGDIHEVLQNVAIANFSPPENHPHIPEKLCRIIHKALAKDRNDRYQSCGDMLADIDDYIYETGLRPGTRKLGDYLKTLFHTDYKMQHINALPTDDHSAQNEDKTVALSNTDTSFFDRIASAIKDVYAHFIRPAKEPLKQIPSKLLSYGIIGPARKAASAFSHLKATAKYQHVLTAINRHKKILTIAALILLLGAGLGIKHTLDQTKVRALLAKAAICLDENRIATPKDDSAYFYFTQVLQIDDDNVQAREGIDHTIEKSIQIAKNLLTVFRHQKALEYIHEGLSIDPDNEKLLELKAVAKKNVSDRIFGGLKNLFNNNDTKQTKDVSEQK